MISSADGIDAITKLRVEQEVAASCSTPPSGWSQEAWNKYVQQRIDVLKLKEAKEFRQGIQKLQEAKEDWLFWKGLERTPPSMKDVVTSENAYQQYVGQYKKMLKMIAEKPELALLYILGPTIEEE